MNQTPYKIHLVTFGTMKYFHRQKLLGLSAKLNRVVDTVTDWSPKKLIAAGFKERVKDMYENFLVKKTNEKSGLPINLSNIHKKTDIFDEIATKTEKKKDNLKENLSVTKKICSPQNLKPILLQEHKVFSINFIKITK